jgi:hypothetical protein
MNMTMGGFVSAYFSNPVFPVLHLVVAVVAFVQVATWRLRARQKVEALRRNQVVAPEAYQDVVATLSPYETLFDFCSSAFIFVGLLGTMYGFALSLAKFSQESTDFSDLFRALSTSAAGILLSILFNAVTAFFQHWSIAPELERLRQRLARSDASAGVAETLGPALQALVQPLHEVQHSAAVSQYLAQQIAATITKLDGTLRGIHELPALMAQTLQVSAANFQQAVAGVGGIPQEVRAAMVQALQTQWQEYERIAQAALTHLNQIRAEQETLHRETRELPSRIQATMEAAARSYQEHLTELNEEVVRKLHRTAAQALEERERQLTLATHQLNDRAQNLQKIVEDVLQQEQAVIRDTVLQSLGELQKIALSYTDQLRSVERTLPQAVLTEHHHLIGSVAQSGQRVEAAVSRLASQLERLPVEMHSAHTRQLELTMHANAQMVDALRQAAAELVAARPQPGEPAPKPWWQRIRETWRVRPAP